MRLLLDENLSPRLVDPLSQPFPGTQHVDQLGLRGRPDIAVWTAARDGGFVLVSKDNDFRQLAFLHGPPPKVVWLAVGNAPTQRIGQLLLERAAELRAFVATSDEALLVVTI